VISDFAGFAVLAAAVVPGYVYVRCAERRAPRHSRSGVLLAGELAFVGILTTAASVLVLLTIARATGWLDTHALISHPRVYMADRPERVLSWLVVVLLGSFGLAWLASVVVHIGRDAVLRPGWSVWHQVLEPGRDRKVAVVVELRDGRRFQGYVLAYDVEEDREKRDLALQQPLFVIDPVTSEQTLLPVHFLIFQSADIAWMSVVYQPAPNGAAEVRTRVPLLSSETPSAVA
jgi:hypothetical protein